MGFHLLNNNVGIKLILVVVKMKKKLLFCSYDLNIGGIETALINLLNNIDYDKYCVTLVLENKGGKLFDKLNKNVKVVEYKPCDYKNILLRKLINLLKQVKWAIFNFKKFDFSCCYATYSLSSNLISRISSNNNVLYVHSNYLNLFGNKDDVKKFFDLRRINDFRKVIFVSNESKNDLCNVYPNIKDKSLVINNLVDQTRILKLSTDEISIKKPIAKTVFIYVGRIEEKAKRLTRMINVFNNIKKSNNNVQLWMIGDGEDMDLIKRKIDNLKLNNDVLLLGMKLNPYPYIKMADYVFLTSEYEGFPVIYNEAIVLNKKIITTIDVTDDYINIPNNFGYIVSKNEKKMTSEILDILNNDKLSLKKIDFNDINKKKIKLLEKIFEGEI